MGRVVDTAFGRMEVPIPEPWPNGGSTPGASVVRKFPFAFDTPGLATGHAVYTPTVGDVLLDMWVEIDTAWDGTTPLGDVSTFHTVNTGWWFNANNPLDMTKHNTVDLFNDTILSTMGEGGTPPSLYSAAAFNGAGAFGSLYRALPGKVVAANPIKVCVSTTGSIDGADPGATQGAAVLYLVIATPA